MTLREIETMFAPLMPHQWLAIDGDNMVVQLMSEMIDGSIEEIDKRNLI